MSPSFPRRQLLVTAAACLGAAPWAVFAQNRGFAPTEGKEYKAVKPPQPTDSGGAIEVLDFFWYGCPACNAVAPYLDNWRKQAPSDVVYKRIPVAFDAQRNPHTRIYYTLEVMKRAEDMHLRVFAAFHKERRKLLDTNEIADYMAAQGIDRKAWLDNFNSFTVATLTARATKTWNAYRIDGTPTVAVDGKWLTSPADAGGLEEFMQTLNFLVDRARRERGMASAKK